jgi:hypothetical protein
VRVSKEEYVSKGVPGPVAGTEVEHEDECAADGVDPEEPAPHVAVNVTVHYDHEYGEGAPCEPGDPCMRLLAPDASIHIDTHIIVCLRQLENTDATQREHISVNAIRVIHYDRLVEHFGASPHQLHGRLACKVTTHGVDAGVILNVVETHIGIYLLSIELIIN